MTSTSVAHHDATASIFAGLLASLERDPSQWRWPASTAAYLRYRIDTLTADLLTSGAAVAEVA